MAHCPHCEAAIEYVNAETIELREVDEIDEEYAEGGRAVATVCPECDSIIGL